VTDRRAQLFAIDLLLAFIPLTIMLGMSANALSGVAFQVQDYANIYSLQRRTTDAADVLVKSPGTPPNWNSTISPSVSGLAYYDNSGGKSYANRIYFPKFSALNVSDIAILTGTDYNFLNISVIDLSLNYSVGSPPPESAFDIAVAERYTSLMFADDYGPFVSAIDVKKTVQPSDPLCAAMFTSSASGAACVHDSVSDLDTALGDFWLYVESFDGSSGGVSFGNGVTNITFLGTGDLDLCKQHKKCDNTEDSLPGDPCEVGDNDVYAKFVYSMNDGTEFIPSSGNSLDDYSDCSNVDKTTAVIPLDRAFLNLYDEIGVRSTSNNNDLTAYGIRVPTGTGWRFVSPDGFGDSLWKAKLTLKVWTE